MIDYMKDYIHRCPSCNKIVGKREYTVKKKQLNLNIDCKTIENLNDSFNTAHNCITINFYYFICFLWKSNVGRI